MVAIYSQMDKIMIGSMLQDISVGYYTTALAICSMWTFIPNAIINSFRPLIMELRVSNKKTEYNLRLQQLYSLIIWFCLLVSIFIFIFAKSIVVLLYGEKFLGTVDALRIAIWFETFAMIGNARGIWIVSENKSKYVKSYLLIGVLINLILNTVLLPKFGIKGASVATLITQFTSSIIAPLLFKETRIHTKIVINSFLLKWKNVV